ncbi:RimK-like protein [Bradyrhizobium sp. BRP22]|uniref:ATP-grasp domain-containing protein n=1 Tax=Bradyrhizobium sp. BRP22 TaxID=2793821 RepID=UPI001CD3E49C|nr:RimK-like protein [Bradyrhizobium sp. BRP22]
MPSSQRIFVDAVAKYCLARRITVEVKSDGWLIVMQRGERRHLAFGYDVGLNSAAAHQIANDKAATAEVLQCFGVPCIPHTLFLGPKLAAYAPASGSWETMLRLLAEHPTGLVVKPNEGTSGDGVVRVTTRLALELAVGRILAVYPSLAISPYVEIEDEVRVVLVDDLPVVVYSKERPFVIGDGSHSLIELALAATPAGRRSAVLSGLIAELGRGGLDAIVPAGERRILNWRHNLDFGARPVLLKHGETRDACIEIAIKAARAIGIRFGSIDVVRTGGTWRILEINAGVKMEALSRSHPELVYAAYEAALDRVFA